ncbi:MAG: DUF1289 domain-containing protein [Methylotenera sp.]|nr:DUF1289 domain-containing protein [Methylotenera sp.]
MTETLANNPPASPCIGVCAIDDSSGFCLGCQRSLDEIKGWWDMTVEQQKVLLDALVDRQMQQANFDD